MTAAITATFSSSTHAEAALEALYDAGFIDGAGVWSSREPQPTIEVRGSIATVETATAIIQDHRPMSLEEACQSMPLRGYEVGSSAHTQNKKTAAEQWRARRAEAASDPQAWAEARRAVRFGGQRPGRDGFGGQTGTRLGSSMRDRYVAVRDDQGPRTLTNGGDAD